MDSLDFFQPLNAYMSKPVSIFPYIWGNIFSHIEKPFLIHWDTFPHTLGNLSSYCILGNLSSYIGKPFLIYWETFPHTLGNLYHILGNLSHTFGNLSSSMKAPMVQTKFLVNEEIQWLYKPTWDEKRWERQGVQSRGRGRRRLGLSPSLVAMVSQGYQPSATSDNQLTASINISNSRISSIKSPHITIACAATV